MNYNSLLPRVIKDLGYCCPWFYYQIHQNRSLIGRELGFWRSTIKVSVHSHTSCAQCPNCQRSFLPLALPKGAGPSTPFSEITTMVPTSELHPLIILDGPDCSGKTTLANELQKSFPTFNHHHFSSPPPGLSEPTAWAQSWALIRTRLESTPVIVDRFILSTLVHAVLRSPSTLIVQEILSHYTLATQGLKVVHIHCLPSSSQLNYFHSSHPPVAYNIKEVNNLFTLAFSFFLLGVSAQPQIFYDWSQHTLQTTRAWITSQLLQALPLLKKWYVV